jgi:hypothetical protein
MPEKQVCFPPHQTFIELLSFEQQMALSNEACQLYEFIWNVMQQKEATEVSLADIATARRSRFHPGLLQAAQSQLHRAGLLHIEGVMHPKHQAHEVRTRYILTDSKTGLTRY